MQSDHVALLEHLMAPWKEHMARAIACIENLQTR